MITLINDIHVPLTVARYVFSTRLMTLHDTIYNVWCIKSSSGYKVKHAFMASE